MNATSTFGRLTHGLVAIAICGSTYMSFTAPVAVAQPTNPDDSSIATAEAEVAQESDNVARLANTLSRTQDDIAWLENDMGRLRESVNKALVDLHDAQASAEQARQDARAARAELDNVQAQMVEAQKLLDEFSRSAYRHGATNPAVSGVAGTANTDNALDRQTYLRTNMAKQRAAIERLDRLRTEKANKESQLREAKKRAEHTEAEATAAKDRAQQSINNTTLLLQQRGTSLAELTTQRDDAQRKLDHAKANAATLGTQRKEYEDYQEAERERERAEAEAAAAEQSRLDAEQAKADAQQRAQEEHEAAARAATEQERVEAGQRAEAADKEAELAGEHARDKTTEAETAQQHSDNAANDAAAAAAALIASASPDHTSLDNPYPTDLDAEDADIAALQAPQQDTQESDPATHESSSVDSGTSASTSTPRTLDSVTESASSVFSGSREEKIEAVIARAQSQLGVPYAWGGGNANGPTQGIRDGGVADSFGDYNKIGFDCSGLVLYAFAGVGIALPHYTGYQYQRGTKVSTSELQRGDLIFYGPNAEDHVAIYLGDGQMLEAPQSGSEVKISPVRWSGMSPNAVRLI